MNSISHTLKSPRRLAKLTAAAALLLLFVLSTSAAHPFARHYPLRLRAATPNQKAVPQYGTLELTLDLTATFDNPFDPEDIDVQALFTSPKGKDIQVNGFFYQSFTRRLDQNSEQLEPAGEPVWKIRFAPELAGTWSYRVMAKDRSGSVRLSKAKFRVTATANPGFIRRSSRNPQVFARDNGEPFFGVGENVCWGGRRGSFDYDEWLPALGKAGGNFIRIWMCSWNCALEWAQTSKGERRSGQYYGVGCYSLDNAWKLDTILDLAERNGLSVMLCLGTYGEFNEGGYFGEGQWPANPYNLANDGPCAKPEEFWTNPAARKLYQQRLRYLAARYGHRTHLQSWEFWNEAKAPAPWVAEMARYLKGTGEFRTHPADPYAHLVSTTYGNPKVWQIPEVDFTMTHTYGIGDVADQAPVIRDEARNHARFGKPHLMAEFGIDWRSADTKYDPAGKAVNLHNGLWAGALSGDAGGAMIWWWDNYIHPKGLYADFGPLRRFVETVPWTRGEWKSLKSECVTTVVSAADKVSVPAKPPVRVYGLSNGRMAIAWIQNTQSHWKNAFEQKEVPVVAQVDIHLPDLPSGRYQAEWWDTHKGEVTRRETMQATDGRLNLRVMDLANDVALRLVGESEK